MNLNSFPSDPNEDLHMGLNAIDSPFMGDVQQRLATEELGNLGRTLNTQTNISIPHLLL